MASAFHAASPVPKISVVMARVIASLCIAFSPLQGGSHDQPLVADEEPA
jgi:hypothetical protein